MSGGFTNSVEKIQVCLKLGKNYMHITCQFPAETSLMDTKRYRLVANSTVFVYFFM